ncbi:ABC transporter permease [Corallococcus exercitus]|uniref:ABC transporter permease n=1 Tax=Corallococcus exercitus TaxID=2316736 RepID=UPI0035D42287
MSPRPTKVLRVAAEEWRALVRNRVAMIASLILVALTVTSALLGLQQRNATEAARARYQAASDEAFDAQPDRHPHRMVHYGQFVFRPLSALAFFDPGVDGFTGTTVFLEGHRQNSANFSEARQSSLLLRFGQLTPAFVLQTLAPLLIVFLAFGAVAREREQGTLRLLLAQGLRPAELAAGKLLAYVGVVALVAAPALGVLAVAALAGWVPPVPSALMLSGYLVYLLIWAVAALLVSLRVRRAQDALILLVALWMGGVILVPRLLPELAVARIPTPTRIETDVAVHRELKQIGDSHNPDDPYFASFKAKTLARYGVAKVEELPVQWAGLVGMEGERLTSELFDRHARESFAREAEQNQLVRRFGSLSPLIALRQLSMSLASTDIESHQDFLEQVERHRYRFVQALNHLQVTKIPNQHAGEDPRIAAEHWKTLPGFTYQAPEMLQLAGDRIRSNLGILLCWLVALLAGCAWAARRLGEVAR